MENYENPENSSSSALQELQETVQKIKQELGKVIVGQESFVELLLIALLADGHVLIEGVPGVAKTLTAKLFAKSLKTGFSRIQFTPDLMPSDVLGTSVLNAKSSDFEFKPGPIFSNIVLIDEINRAPAKTQAALFEVMAERQVTMDGKQHALTPPFMVVATQNPIEQEGTYALPEAQLDRFLFKLIVPYPQVEEEYQILETHHLRQGKRPEEQINPVLDPEQLSALRAEVQAVKIEPRLLRYIADVTTATRQHPQLFLGASPRASLAVLDTAKAAAAIAGRDYIIPEDIHKVLVPVVRHRILLHPEREMEGGTPEQVVDMILKSKEIPR